MAVVGGITVISISAPIEMAGFATRTSERPGVDGHDIRLLGMRGNQGTFMLELDCVSAAALATAKINFKSMQSDVITVTDNLGLSWANLLVQNVRTVAEFPLLSVTGGVNGGNYMLQMMFEYLVVATYYD